ncbi:MAG: SDR family oxidoreductase, partial [Propionibacteriaceae bacterium]|nr:SDR family oxidoreductase [Propionibacteriaceae bacterium]
AGRAYYVTGVSRGIGQAIALALLDEGALVAGCARDARALEVLRDGLPENWKDRLITTVADVGDAPGLTQAVVAAASEFSRLDGVVANAGIGVTGGVLSTSAADWDEQLHTKVHSVLNLVTAALPMLRSSDAARIVVINGVIAHYPEPPMAASSAGRAAVASLTRLLAVELAPDILVNSVNLGAIATDRQRDMFRDSGSSGTFDQWAQSEAIRRGILLGRLGDADEVAPMIAMMLSPLSSYLTGTSIDISGGSATNT